MSCSTHAPQRNKKDVMPSLLSLAVNGVFAAGFFLAGVWITHDHYEAKLTMVKDAAQRQKEDSDEAARKLASALAASTARFESLRSRADVYRVSRAGHNCLLDSSGLHIVNDALNSSPGTPKAVPQPDASR